MPRNIFTCGSFTSEQWKCDCGLDPLWLTSGREASMGQKFLKCRRRERKEQCDFFLWESEEAEARVARKDHPLRPRTPPGSNNNGAPPTPNTGESTIFMFGRLHADPPTPTPQRFSGSSFNFSSPPSSSSVSASASSSFSNHTTEGLTTAVLDIIRLDGTSLRTSTELRLRRLLDSEVAVYAAKLKSYENTVARLSERLDGLESVGVGSPGTLRGC